MFSLHRSGVRIYLSLSCGAILSPREYYAAIPPTSLKLTHSIFVSNSTNPYFNLTFEDWSVPLPPYSRREGDFLVQAFPLPPTKRPALASLQRHTLYFH